MELQTFAHITGILVLLIGFPLLVKADATVEFILHLMQSSLFLRPAGALIVVIAVLTLKQDYSIATDTAGILRLLAWLGFIKGLTAAWRPDVLRRISERVLGDPSIRPVLGLVSVALGGLILYAAQLV